MNRSRPLIRFAHTPGWAAGAVVALSMLGSAGLCPEGHAAMPQSNAVPRETPLAPLGGEWIEALKQGPDVLVRSGFSAAEDVVIKVGLGAANRQINFAQTRLVPAGAPLSEAAFQDGTLIHGCGDDATPWNLNGTYIGANHGCSDVCAPTCPRHGLAEADLGSAWRDEAGALFYLVKIADPDTLWLLSENKGRSAVWSFTPALSGKTLTRAEPARVLAVEKTARVQLTPACRIVRQDYLADGQTPVPEGRPITGRFLEIREEYDIISPASVLADIVKHPGEARDFTAPHLEGVVRNRIAYRFYPQGCAVVEHRSMALQDFNLGYMGFIQSARLNRGAFAWHDYYIPKTAPFVQDGRRYDFQAIQDYASNPPSPLRFSAALTNVTDPDNLPDRFIQLLGNAGADRPAWRVGYALGYVPTRGLARPAERARNTANALMLYTSAKSYPSAIDRKMGNPIRAGTEFACSAYRCYFDAAAQAPATACYRVPDGDGWIVFADYHGPVERARIRLPAALAGKPVRVIEKTDSVTLHSGGTAPAEGLQISVAGSYGYLVAAVP